MLTGAGVLPGRALADGDPASDVLASQPLFLPADGGFPPSQAARLTALLDSARHSGIPVRVAVIATPADLGSVSELWRKPQSYAGFLAQELAQVYRGTLVVAMPNGFGVAVVGAPGGGSQSALASRGPSSPLLPATMKLVQSLARARGHRLALPSAAAATGSRSGRGTVDTGSWLALAAGAGLIVAAWTVSLRARPLGRLRRAR